MTNQLDPSRIAGVFKAYDVRGIVPDELTPELAYRIGRAIVAYLDIDEVAVGRDMRVSGESLAGGLIDGIRDQGATVYDLGLVSTDALYFAVGRYGHPAGVMITASHNPPEYNGFKICREEARALSFEDGIKQIRDLVIAGEFPESKSGKRGDVVQRDIIQAYADYVLGLIGAEKIKPLKIAIDAGNGMGGKLAPSVFAGLQCEVVPLYFELDGTFPNHHADPSKPANMRDLQQAVIDNGCDLGAAFDGDADRVFMVDEKGGLIGGDMTTAMVAIAMLKRYPGAAVCYNLICSDAVPETIKAHGGRPVRTPVGHSLIKKIMRDEDAVFGGEHSGHFYFRDNWYADSGMIALLTVLQLVSEAGKPLSEVLGPLDTRVRTGEINLKVSDKDAAMAKVEAALGSEGAAIDRLDGVSARFPEWWVNVRASNTEPLLRVNAEARTPEELEAVKDKVLALIETGS
jgi:phosphomannomutase